MMLHAHSIGVQIDHTQDSRIFYFILYYIYLLCCVCFHFIRRLCDNLSSFRHTIEFHDDDDAVDDVADECASFNQTLHQLLPAIKRNAKCETEYKELNGILRIMLMFIALSDDGNLTSIIPQNSNNKNLQYPDYFYTVFARPFFFSFIPLNSHRTVCIDNTNLWDTADKTGLSKQNQTKRNETKEIWIHVSLIWFDFIPLWLFICWLYQSIIICINCICVNNKMRANAMNAIFILSYSFFLCQFANKLTCAYFWIFLWFFSSKNPWCRFDIFSKLVHWTRSVKKNRSSVHLDRIRVYLGLQKLCHFHRINHLMRWCWHFDIAIYLRCVCVQFVWKSTLIQFAQVAISLYWWMYTFNV